MKLIVLLICSILSLGTLAGSLSAAPTTAPVAVNKLCPVTHEAVDPKVPTVQYKGMTIGFCCDDCIKDFNANPEKYMANLK